jgi:cell division protein FtsI (penicillin-binding protein 3)/stage V sporulation protein D (sporulation-specific penicillin-binding protein)
MTQASKRINFFIFIIFLIFILIGVRLFYLQIVHGRDYRREAEDQYFYTTGDNFDRGAINFTNKDGSPAVAVQMTNEYDIDIDPKTISADLSSKINSSQSESELQREIYNKLLSAFEKNKPKENIATTSTSTTGVLVDENTFFNKINKKNSSFEILATNVNEYIANDILGLKLKGVIVNRKKSRVYFSKDTGAKVLGFVGYSGNERVGLYGVEKYYNDVLMKSSTVKSNFFAEIFSDFNSTQNAVTDTKSLPDSNLEGDINLTIDTNSEAYLHKILVDARAKWQSEKIGGIIMDINDGSIVAMDEVPGFDPNDYRNVSDISLYNNDLISGVYEMGSIIKPLTVAAALDSNTVNENTTYYDAGSVMLNGYKVSNYDGKARGPNTPIQQILSQSLNVGIAFLVEKMGNETLSKYFHGYGLGDYTGIDLPSEAHGLVANLDSNVLVDSVTAGFGQGIALTPIQTIRALATLGNGGKLVTPHIVKSITYDNGETKVMAQDDPIQVFENSSTSRRISNILTRVVDDSMHMKNPKYTVAAKTGTAQMVNPTTGKYYDDRYLHSFMGYFPATKPRYIIFLYQTYPKGAQYASQTLKDSFFNLVNFLVNYYEIPPDR